MMMLMDADNEHFVYEALSGTWSGHVRLMPGLSVEHCEPHSDSLLRCPQGDHFPTEIWVRNVYPPIQELQPRVTVVVIIFLLFFIVGICGNSSVLTMIRGVMKERRSRSKGTSDNAILYIASLCVCDFLMSLSLPPAIMDSVIGFWMFGTWMCKIHHICGSVGRILSTFLITAMSFDRYVAVCFPHHRRLRSKTFVIGMIIFLSSFAFALLLPMLTYARAKEMVLHELRSPDSNNITRVRVFKCSDMMPTSVFYWFTTTTFILGYVIPLTLIVLFNMRLIKKLYAHQRVLPRSTIPIRRIVKYTILIATLYFCCWSPYWFSVLYAIIMSLLGLSTTDSDMILFVIYCVHLLPYFVSSTNWILYGLLNTQLQMKHDTNHSEENVSMMPTTNRQMASSIPDRVNNSRFNESSSPRTYPSTCSRCQNSASTPLFKQNSSSSLRFYEETDQAHL